MRKSQSLKVSKSQRDYAVSLSETLRLCDSETRFNEEWAKHSY